MYDFDLFVIGAGSGGVRASRIASGFGARVAVAEESRLGGTCVNLGCVPKKLFVYAAEIGRDLDDASGFGWRTGSHVFHWSELLRNKNREIERLNGVYRQLLANAGVQILTGRARIVDPHTVEVNGARYSTDFILVATGSRPSLPDVPGIAHAVTSNEAFFLRRLPQRVIIVGGGYIGVEFTCIFRGLGVDVTQIYRGPLFLRGFDLDVRSALAAEMRKQGITLRFDTRVQRIEKPAEALRVFLDDASALTADLVMYATGRVPNTGDLGLREIGVQLNQKGAVVVDAYSRSSVANVFAVGDCTDRMNLTPIAIAEGNAVAQTLFNNNPTMVDYSNVPTAVFSHPSIGAVGLTEEAARQRYQSIDIYHTSFRPLKHTLTGRDERTFMKLVVERDSGRVLGCHMVGPDAGEIIQGLAVALRCGATKAQFDATIGVHPTAAEELVNMRSKAPDS
jgi:glutathione reductase (NADPH)